MRSRLRCEGDAGERLSCEVLRESDEETELRSATARGREAELRQCKGEIETWECEDLRVIFERGRDEWGLRVIEKWERVSEEWFWERAERRRIGGKKICWSRFRMTPFRGKKKKEAGRRRLRVERVRTVRTGHGSQNQMVGPRSGWFHAFFAWNGSLP